MESFPQTGEWNLLRPQRAAKQFSDEQVQQIRKLETLGYVAGSAEPTTDLVITQHDRERACQGLNFYTSGHGPEAMLMDMDGNERHRWQCRFEDAFPESPLTANPVYMTNYWRRAHLFENGDVLAIFEGLGLVKLNSNSEVIWSTLNGAHHDLHVMPDGRIFVLARSVHIVPRIDPGTPTVEDFVVVLDASGAELKRVSLLACYDNAGLPPEPDPQISQQDLGTHKVLLLDVHHTNTLEVLDGRIADRLPAFRANNVMISQRTLNQIAVVDLDQEKVVWTMRGSFKGQHDPQVLPNNNLLLFDNGVATRKSAVIEFDPVTRQPRWEYRGSDERPFYSHHCGTVQRLSNENTLITESAGGRAFEVTPEGEIVWEFYNPNRAGENDEYVATLFEVLRLPPDFPTDWIGARPVK